MGMTKVEKSKNPRKNVRREATERASSPTSVALVAQLVRHRSVLGVI
jgi:hypothetical protein